MRRNAKVIYQINALNFLNSHKLKNIGDIPDSVLNALRWKWNVDYIYLLSVWERTKLPLDSSHPGSSFLFGKNGDCAEKSWSKDDIYTSGFSIRDYKVDTSLGSNDDLFRLKQRINSRGMKLVLDFVPNHTGWDFPWIYSHPEYYMQFPNTTLQPGAESPHMVWGDTAQLNYICPEMQYAMLDKIQSFTYLCDGLRCDMAHCVIKDVFLNTWATEDNKTTDKERIPEFWQELRSRVGDDFFLMAEAYHHHEADLIKLGFNAVYDKENGFYDCLLETLIKKVGKDNKNHIANYIHNARSKHIIKSQNSTTYGSYMVRFLENHDEERAAYVFSTELYHAVQILANQYGTLEGYIFLHDGQLTGARIRTPIQVATLVPEEKDEDILAIYEEALEAQTNWRERVPDEFSESIDDEFPWLEGR